MKSMEFPLVFLLCLVNLGQVALARTLESAPEETEASVIQRRLAKVECFVHAGDWNTALALLENLGMAYPRSAAFHERGAALALENGALEIASRIAREGLERDRENKALSRTAVAIRDRMESVGDKVNDLDKFERHALALEVEKRRDRLSRVLARFNRKQKLPLRLTRENQDAVMQKLVEFGSIRRAIRCPLPGSYYLSSADGSRILCSAVGQLRLPERTPVVTIGLLTRALRSSSPVARATAREILLGERRHAEILAAVPQQFDGNVTVEDRILALGDLRAALCTGIGAQPAKRAASCKELPPICKTHLADPDPEVRQLASEICKLLAP
jgi:hypothetical protein